MHTAFECAPLLAGYKGRPESIVVHGAKLFVGSASGSLSVYRLDQETLPVDDAASIQSVSTHNGSPRKRRPNMGSRSSSALDPSSGAGPSQPIQTSPQFSRKAIDQLGVIKETNQLVSLSDGCIALHDLSTLEQQVQLTQTKGALTFSIDTSIQKRLASQAPDYGPGPLGGMASVRGSKYVPTTSAATRAFRPGAVGDLNANTNGNQGTVSRNRHSVFDVPSKDWQEASMRGMDAMARYKEEERRKAMEGARFGGSNVEGPDGVMTLVTILAVGLKRKIILFRWVDGEFWDTREINLQHTPRSLAFVTPTKLFMGYNAIEYGVLSVPLAADSTVSYTHPSSRYGASSSRREAQALPPTNSTSGPLVDLTSPTLSAWHVEDFDLSNAGEAGAGTGGGTASSTTQSGATAGFGAALGGLSGYMGLSSKGKMSVLQVDGGEVLFIRGGTGIFLGSDGRPTRNDGVEWPVQPLEISFARPYVFAILPAGSVPALKHSGLPNANNPILQIRSIGTLFAVQTLCFPPVSASKSTKSTTTSNTPPLVRLLTTSSSSKPPVYVVVTPGDKTALEKEGSTIWRLEMQGWGRQIDELVEKGEFEEALGLLDSVDNVILEDKDERRAYVQGLFAVSLFADGKFDEAIEMFMELNTNPAKVIALYPSNIAGDLSRDREEWFAIFGGKTPPRLLSASVEAQGGTSTLSSSPTPSHATATTSIARSRLGAFLPTRRPQSILGESMLPGGSASSLSSSPAHASPTKPQPGRSALGHEADSVVETASIRSVRTSKEAPEMRNTGSGSKEAGLPPIGTNLSNASREALDALGRFLADRRRIFKPILETSPHLETKDHMAMSQIKRDTYWLLSLPSKPFAELDKEELIAVAQTVDTALFKTFLEIKPALIGSLCRIENWCEVEQVEELLKERKKFSELIALYGGKEMHSKALGLLKQFAEDEEDEEEKTRPTIQYLQNLGPEFIDTILETSHWVLELNAELGMEIFTADTGRVGSWPRLEIVEDLDKFNKDLCAMYLEYAINSGGERDADFHDRLIRLYLRKAAKLREGKSDPGDGKRKAVMQKLLDFLRRSSQYRPEQILVRLPADDEDRDMFEARAVLLGRMGQHEGALGIYVRKLNDPDRAEQYCKEVWQAMKESCKDKGVNGRDVGPRHQQEQPRLYQSMPQSFMVDEGQKRQADRQVFLTLVKIYLSGFEDNGVGTESASESGSYGAAIEGELAERLEAALGLIKRHAAKLDLVSVVALLPSSVTLSRISSFVSINLRDQTRKQHEAKVLKEIRATRSLQLEDSLCKLQNRRIKVTETRTCPQCHKRLGTSVVAVHPVTGSVMHYFCSLQKQQPK